MFESIYHCVQKDICFNPISDFNRSNLSAMSFRVGVGDNTRGYK